MEQLSQLLNDVPAQTGLGGCMPAHPDGEADSAERRHKATSLLQPPATALGQAEEEAGIDRGRWENPCLLTRLQLHPLLLLFPPSPSKGNPTGLGTEISYHHTVSAGSSLLH